MPLLRLTLPTLLTLALGSALFAQPLPGTNPLKRDGDLATQMVAGIDRYLMRELRQAPERRRAVKGTQRSMATDRDRLRQIIGAVDQRLAVRDIEYVASLSVPALVVKGTGYSVYAVRWPVLEGVDAEGLLLQPDGKPLAHVIALPDADWTPEMLVGLAPGVPTEAQFARRLAENGFQVIIPTLIDRQDTWSGNPRYRMTNQPHREFVYRMAYEMGRHIIGYEVQKVLAAVDW